jgi:RNA polymerase sigma factor (TIGR02999 family)
MWHEENWLRRSRSSAAKSDNFLHESDRRRYIIGAHNVPIRPMEDNAPTSPQVTQLLVAWGEGDQVARDQLMALVYEELHRLAHRYMKRESPGHTLQTSALVNEAFVRLVGQRNVRWQNRAHFFGVAAQTMRHILVDYARSRNYAKRGGGAAQISLDEALIVSDERSAEVVSVHEALERLAEFDPRKSQLVELRFFGGLSIDETAEVLNVSPGTVMRDWTLAKAWLRREISSESSAD